MIMDRWTPAAEGSAFEFTPTMKPLEPFRDRILVMSGLAQVNGRALGRWPWRSCARRRCVPDRSPSEENRRRGHSLRHFGRPDRGKGLGKQTQLASLEIGLESQSLAGGCDSGI